MFRIAKEQLQTLSAAVEQSFVGRTVHRLRNDFPSEIETHGLQGQALEALVQRGVAEARESPARETGQTSHQCPGRSNRQRKP